ncbi:hypothetical protein EBU58_13480 [bacterium]|nr:hypothetical protein [bacterium]
MGSDTYEEGTIDVESEDLPEQLLDAQLFVCPLGIEVGQAFTETAWDIVLIDEAHHLQPDSGDFALAEQLAEQTDAPLHIGITEAGGQRAGTVKSAIGLGNLLWAGIGDTLRVSLSADPAEEVRVGYEMLKSLGLRRRGVTVISCPSCARQQFDVISSVQQIEERLAHISVPMTVSVIGCVVNGPGEARETDIGLTGGGKGVHQIYIGGLADHRLEGGDLVDYIVGLVEKKAAEVTEQEESAS